MKQEPQPQRVTPDRQIEDKQADENSLAGLDPALERGAEPYWMQDIRLAARRIAEARARHRAAPSSSSSGDGSEPGQD